MTIKVSKPEINIREKLNDLDFDKVPFQKMPAGSVLQVVSYRSATYTTTTSTSLVDIGGATVTITPTSSSSKIVLTASIPGMYHGNGGGQSVSLALKRNSTQLFLRDRQGYKDSSGWDTIDYSSVYEDSPNTTSAVTYQYQFACSQSTTRANDHYNNGATKHITVVAMEIAQ